MALLGLGGKGLRERLRRQYGILPPGSLGQTLFDEIIPVVLVDDLTRGLVVDEHYRPPATGRTNQTGVAAKFAFSQLQARAGALLLVERVEWRTEAAAGLRLKVGAVTTSAGGDVKVWRDRRLSGDPTAGITQGAETSQSGSTVLEMQGISTDFRSIELGIILEPSEIVLKSTLTLWHSTVEQDLDVNWFWREIVL